MQEWKEIVRDREKWKDVAMAADSNIRIINANDDDDDDKVDHIQIVL